MYESNRNIEKDEQLDCCQIERHNPERSGVPSTMRTKDVVVAAMVSMFARVGRIGGSSETGR